VTRRSDNPFLRHGLDPTEDLGAITERLRELAEDAADPAERDEIRAAWEALTRSPMRRFELALDVSPAPPPVPVTPEASVVEEPFEPRLADLLTPGPVTPRLGPMTIEEARTLRVELGFLVREDEAKATGPIGQAPRGARDGGAKR
jgi:hypothetical protein